MICGKNMGRKGKKKKKTLQQIKDYLNDQSIRIKQISREVFMDLIQLLVFIKIKRNIQEEKKHKKRLDNE